MKFLIKHNSNQSSKKHENVKRGKILSRKENSGIAKKGGHNSHKSSQKRICG